jgi:radical SAM superfamily enzyme YgiQ (UPF0313 family)
MPKIMLFYPPGPLYQRGEDRCQVNVEDSASSTVRACNDLGYASAILTRDGHTIFLRDYQTEQATLADVFADFDSFAPDALFVSITNATIFEDLAVIDSLKARNPKLVVVIKGAIFFNPEQALLDQLNLSSVNYLIGGESEFVIDKVIAAHFNQSPELETIPGIVYRHNGQWTKTSFTHWETDLDLLPFPDRLRMNNRLYIRPDTEEIQATIATSRGCPSACIYCMTPVISGRPLRLRSLENIFQEIQECYEKYQIRNFFFKSDTFTINKKWVLDLCGLIVASNLKGKLSWVANSRVKPLDLETLQSMKAAGCWLIAFGYESGSQETLLKIKKGTTPQDNLTAARLAKKAGLKTFGFFLIGLPWENQEHLTATKKHMFELNPDFVEVHIALPFYGTPLYAMAKAEGLIDETTLGKDYFNAPTIGTKHLTIREVQSFLQGMLRQFHLRPTFILKKIIASLLKPKTLKNYFVYGMRMLKRRIG